jgi:hypothetical protein
MRIWILSFILLVSVGFTKAFASPGTTICISASDAKAVEKTAALLRTRLSYIHLNFSEPLSYNRRASILVSTADKHLIQGLISSGRISLRFMPHGPEYPSAKPFASTSLSVDAFGNHVIIFAVGDPHAFYNFTRRNVGKRLGIFVDGQLLTAPVIQEPIGRNGEVAAPRGTTPMSVLAAIMNSGPIPENVTVSLAQPGSPCK